MALAPNTVVRVGTDSSGRAIYMTRRMRRWWRRTCKRIGFTPTIVQGAFMGLAGGGADASAGYHDGGGCLDLRAWDLSDTQHQRLIRQVRSMGAAIWYRGKEHGMDPHFHLIFGSDYALSAGAKKQWQDYKDGFDGLAGRGPDYHWRPDPLAIFPPASTRKARDLLTEAKDELRRLGFPVAARVRKIRDRIPK